MLHILINNLTAAASSIVPNIPPRRFVKLSRKINISRVQILKTFASLMAYKYFVQNSVVFSELSKHNDQLRVEVPSLDLQY